MSPQQKRRKKNWQAYSRDRAYGLLTWLRRQGVTGINGPQVDAIILCLHCENAHGYARALRATKVKG